MWPYATRGSRFLGDVSEISPSASQTIQRSTSKWAKPTCIRACAWHSSPRLATARCWPLSQRCDSRPSSTSPSTSARGRFRYRPRDDGSTSGTGMVRARSCGVVSMAAKKNSDGIGYAAGGRSSTAQRVKRLLRQPTHTARTRLVQPFMAADRAAVGSETVDRPIIHLEEGRDLLDRQH